MDVLFWRVTDQHVLAVWNSVHGINLIFMVSLCCELFQFLFALSPISHVVLRLTLSIENVYILYKVIISVIKEDRIIVPLVSVAMYLSYRYWMY